LQASDLLDGPVTPFLRA